MTLTSLGGLVRIGHANRQGNPSIAVLGSTTVDAVNEACIMVGQLSWSDGGTHTVDTSGSSSLQWRTATVTFANAATTVKVGLAAVDTTTGPPVRAVNVADVITFGVNASFAGGGGGITTGAWQTSVPTAGTKTIVHGDLIAFAVQMTARGGVDSVLVSSASAIVPSARPSITDFTGAAYSNPGRLPNVIVTASDGTVGYIIGGYVASVGSTSQTWNSGSALVEYGNALQIPVPARAYGIVVANTVAGDCDFILYATPFGTPAPQRTVSVDLNTIASSVVTNELLLLFSSSFDLAANTDYAVIAKPTSATIVAMNYKTYNAAADQASDLLGTTCYAVNRASGAFGVQNLNKDRFTIGLLIGAFDAGGIDISTVSANISDSRRMIGY